jgi:hypothetical protein
MGNEKKGYYKLPEKIIGNDLYMARQNFNSLYDCVVAGNDFNKKHFDSIMNQMKAIGESAEFIEVK